MVGKGVLAVSSEEVGPASTAHEGVPKAEYLPFVNEFIKASCVCGEGGGSAHQLSLTGGDGRSDLGHVTADAIQQILAEEILQKPIHVVTLTDGTNNALCKKFFVQGLDVELDGGMTLGNGQARGAVVVPLDLVEGKV